ncbi:hypothetical protein CR919_03930 [Stenotrophomonas sp. LMG 10879]|nr:hypothetical protein CR919_03930 [Stenotrophomonas sp. LMG 10879]
MPAAGRQPQQQKLGSCGLAGWGRRQGPLQVRPCKLGRRIHAAHAPATGPTPPSTVFRELSERHGLPLVGVDLGRHVDPHHAWMLFDPISKYSISIEIHPRARGSNRHQETVRGGAVSDCGVSAAWMRLPSLQGRTCGVPAIRHRPTIPRNPAVAVA